MPILCYAIKIFVTRLSCISIVRGGGNEGKRGGREKGKDGGREREEGRKEERKRGEREVGEGGREVKKTRKKETSRVFHSFLGEQVRKEETSRT